MWLVMTAFVLLFWVVVLLLIRAFLPVTRPGDQPAARPEPLTLLKERLARGEITPEEYEERRRILTDDR
jgi:putative membrane protein